uniref:Uncharacterized protein n=1 Tax=Cyprinodon variegatus TaxID=28743 RepID=A0A3Q2C7N5_CYPVA
MDICFLCSETLLCLSSAEPLQDWLNSTESRVQESTARLHDLPTKKQELSKLQVFCRPKSFSYTCLNNVL